MVASIIVVAVHGPQSVPVELALVLAVLPRRGCPAALARGLEHDPRARLTPAVLRVVAHARATRGDALHARRIHD